MLLDRLEEEFLYHGARRRPGASSTSSRRRRRDPGFARASCSPIREDALAKLDRFKSRVPNVFGNYLRLEHLDRAAGREAIVGPSAATTSVGDATGRDRAGARRGRARPGRRRQGRARRDRPRRQCERNAQAASRRRTCSSSWPGSGTRGASRLPRRSGSRRSAGSAAPSRSSATTSTARSRADPEQQDIAARSSTTSSRRRARRSRTTRPISPAISAHDRRARAGAGEARRRADPPAGSGRRGPESPRYEIYHDILAEAVLAWRTRHESAARARARPRGGGASAPAASRRRREPRSCRRDGRRDGLRVHPAERGADAGGRRDHRHAAGHEECCESDTELQHSSPRRKGAGGKKREEGARTKDAGGPQRRSRDDREEACPEGTTKG